MEYQKTAFKDLIICNPRLFLDDRGYFFESFNLNSFTEFVGFTPDFVQDNQSRSSFGVLRGLHFQTGSHAQAKLVRVLEGEVLDVVVDLRKDQPTFGTSFSIQLSAQNRTQLYVPKGMAHGFVTLSDNATFAYKCEGYYHKESESGLLYNDPDLDIDWRISPDHFILSDKDKKNPRLEELPDSITF